MVIKAKSFKESVEGLVPLVAPRLTTAGWSVLLLVVVHAVISWGGGARIG